MEKSLDLFFWIGKLACNQWRSQGDRRHARRKNPLPLGLCPWPVVGVGSGRAQSGGDDIPLIIDFKCLESVSSYDDAVNSMAVRFDRFVFIGSVDGTIKVWRREVNETNGAIRSMCWLRFYCSRRVR